jgi:hypothetical protein
MTLARSIDAGDDPDLTTNHDRAIVAIALARAAIGQYGAAVAAVAVMASAMWPGWQERSKAYAAIASLQARDSRTAAATTFALAVSAALREYEPMEDQRTGAVLESIVLAQARVGLRSAAWAAVDQLRDVELAGFWHRSPRADRCLATLAGYYLAASRHDDARRTVARIRDVHVREETERRFVDGVETDAAAASEGWEAQARRLLDEWETKRITPGARPYAGPDVRQLAEAARAHDRRTLATRLIAVACALLPCHEVVEAACRLDPSVATVLDEFPL